MSENNGQGGDDEPRTIFIPQPSEPPAQAGNPPAAGGWGSPPPDQVAPAAPEAPSMAPPPSPVSATSAVPPTSAAPLAETEFPGGTSFQMTAGEPRDVREGDVLNHLYQVRRFIARGGMGQVFEGVNINNEDERVAIKVILPHLARDPNVLAMFRKEARTLTRLSHPALVQYRTLAMEPQLGVFYIVTEYIDGRNLSDVLSTIEASPAQLLALIRTLAEGLAVAHSLGAIHRDISPDNIMLEGGRLERAKVIDFGIAKDLDAGSQTIVGDGFAGKLNYVAPEQLGDFGRQVGSWTDVYSLGLTILALINKRDVNMGGSLVDAVDKRRAGPDLSPVPSEVRPVLEAMLRPNPADRLRTMEDVIAAVGAGATSAVPAHQPALASPPPKAKAPPKPKPAATEGGEGNQRRVMIGAGVAAAVVLLGGLGYAISSGGDDEAEVAQPGASTAPVPGGDPLKTAQAALDSGLTTVGCSWLDVSDLQVQGTDVALAVKGVAGRPVDAQNEIGKLLSARGLRAASIDFSDVSQISPSECAPIEAFRQIRGKGASHLSVPQVKWELTKRPAGEPDAGQLSAPVVVNIDLNGVAGDIGLVGIEENGAMSFDPRADRSYIEKLQISSQTSRLEIPTDHTGWSGILMVWGKGPFDTSLLNGTMASRGADWAQRFLAEAKAKGWQSDMVWYKTVNDQPD